MKHRRARRRFRGGERSRARILGSVLLLALVVAGGAASAFWTAHGQGTGAALTESVSSVTFSPAAPASQLYPGSSADVVLTITNPNKSSVHVGSLALDAGQGTGGFAADAGHAACGVSSLAFVTATNGGAGWTVPGAVGGTAGTSAVSLPNALSMDLDASDACQGANLTVYLSAGS